MNKIFLYIILLIIFSTSVFAFDFTVNFQPNEDVWLFDGSVWISQTADGTGKAVFDVVGGDYFVSYRCGEGYVYKEFSVSGDTTETIACQPDVDLVDLTISVKDTSGNPITTNSVTSYWHWPFGTEYAIDGYNFDGVKTILTNKGLHDFTVTYQGADYIFPDENVISGILDLQLSQTFVLNLEFIRGGYPWPWDLKDLYKDGRQYGYIQQTRNLEQGIYLIGAKCDTPLSYYTMEVNLDSDKDVTMDCDDLQEFNIKITEGGIGSKGTFETSSIDSLDNEYFMYYLSHETNDSGDVSLFMADGKYDITATHKGMKQTKIINFPSETLADFDFPPPTLNLSIKLVDGDNNILTGKQIVVRDQDELEQGRITPSIVHDMTTNSNGEASVKLYSGKYTILAKCGNLNHVVKDIELSTNKAITVKCGGAPTIVKIINEKGNLTSSRITTKMVRSDGFGYYQIDDADETYDNPAIFDLTAGTYNVQVRRSFEAPPLWETYGSFSINEGEVNEIIVTLDDTIPAFAEDVDLITTTPTPAPGFNPNLLMLAIIVFSLSIFFGYTRAVQR